MSFFPTVWNVLHDGDILAIGGQVPGTVRFEVEIRYLRERFAEPGRFIVVTVEDCSLLSYLPLSYLPLSYLPLSYLPLSYLPSESEQPIVDPVAIAALRPEILQAELHGELCTVKCADGTLEMVASGGSLALDSGRSLHLDELLAVAEDYWREFESRGRATVT